MTMGLYVWLLVGIAFVAANLPWLSEHFFFVVRPREGHKRIWQRWLEWLVLYGVVGAGAVRLEYVVNGERYPQGWEFYVATFCLFLVFALPGFIYRHDLRRHLDSQRS